MEILGRGSEGVEYAILLLKAKSKAGVEKQIQQRKSQMPDDEWSRGRKNNWSWKW
jgi:hypothetical protein